MSNQLGFSLKRALEHLRRLGRDDKGATAVVVAIMSPMLIGGMALGAETGYWYHAQRKLQHAADLAAHAAAIRKRVGDHQAGLQNAALRVATGSGFQPYVDTSAPNPIVTNLTVNNPPLSGSMKGKAEAVEVNLFEVKPRLLSSIFSSDPVRIETRAVAKVTGGTPVCVLALSDTKSRAVEVSGSSSATLKDCSIAVNSVQDDAYYMPNSTAKLTADCISTVGGSVVKDSSKDLLNLKECDGVQENAPKTLDPYADVPEPTITTCEPKQKFKDERIYNNSGTRCFKDLELNGTVIFNAGLYIIDGGTLSITGGKIIGSNVTFFFANNATAKLAGNPFIDLSAPPPDTEVAALKPYIGILFFGARCDLDPTKCDEVFTITGNPGSRIQGALYLPGSEINFLGNSTSSSSCLQIISDKVTFTGNSTITMGAACEAAGTRPILTGQLVKLVE